MLAELRPKSQITIPKDIVVSLELNTGDMLEVYEKDGIICLCPVAVYPKSYVDDLLNEVNSIKADISQGKKPVFDNIDSLFEELNK